MYYQIINKNLPKFLIRIERFCSQSTSVKIFHSPARSETLEQASWQKKLHIDSEERRQKSTPIQTLLQIYRLKSGILRDGNSCRQTIKSKGGIELVCYKNSAQQITPISTSSQDAVQKDSGWRFGSCTVSYLAPSCLVPPTLTDQHKSM